ncbi:MAG: orotate phosphoribosyltransferase [Pseudomonadales bacterium]
MNDYQTDFIQLALENEVLRFGEYELKSGRVSPYFFNAGLIRSGAALRRTGLAYVETIRAANISFDMLFGPAYKGIPLATAAAVCWNERYEADIPVVYNRKEAKTHGEGGSIVGGPLQGKVLIVDDVITAGTAVREVLQMIEDAGAEPAGIVVGLDRQERGKGEMSAIQELQQEYDLPVAAIISFANLITFLESSTGRYMDNLPEMNAYRSQYGIS